MLKFGNTFVNVGGTYLTGFKSPIRTITIIPSNGGVIDASPNKGNDGDLVTLSNTPNTHYHFNGYSLTGGTLTGSQFYIQGNASAQGSFEQDPIRNLTLSQQIGGTITANKTTGWDGDDITLSYTTDAYYTFDSYSLTGSTLYNTNKFKFTGSDVTAKANFILNLPTNYIRVKFKNGYNPTQGNTQTIVDSTNNIWDIYKQSNNWDTLFSNCTDLTDVIGGNTSAITSTQSMFNGCTALSSMNLFNTQNVKYSNMMFKNCYRISSVPLYDFSNVVDTTNMFNNCSSLYSIPSFNFNKATNMNGTFHSCISLTSIPLFNMPSVNSMMQTFWRCTNVKTGAYNLYKQVSAKVTDSYSHTGCFFECGINTTQGAAELAQIPSDWK